MAATPNLDLPHVAEGQGRPDIQHNDSLDQLDAAISEQVEVSLSSGTASVTLAQAQRLAVLRVTDAPSAGTGVVTIDPVRRPFVVKSALDNTNDFVVAIGATEVTIGPGEGFLLYGTGTADGLEIILSGGAGGGVTREYVDAAIQAAVGSEASGGSGTLDVSLAGGDVSLTTEQYETNGTFWVSGQGADPEPAHYLDLPAAAKTVTVMGDPDNGRTFFVRRGTAQASVAVGEAVTLTTGEGDLLRVVARSRPTFRRLLDTPNSYSGHGGKLLRLNAAERKIEFLPVIGGLFPGSPADGQILYWDAGTAAFVWGDPAGGSVDETARDAAAAAQADADAALTEAKAAVLWFAVSDEATALTTGAAKITFRVPHAMTLTTVRASLSAASSSGAVQVDINESGASIFSTALTIDEGEKTSTTAATPAVIANASLADDAEITVDIDSAGTGVKGLKLALIGTRG